VAVIRDRYLLKDFLEYTHIHQCLLAPYTDSYPLVEPRELLPSFEKNYYEYKSLPSFSLVVFNRPLVYAEEDFQFDLLYPPEDGKRRLKENLDKLLPHLDRELRPTLRQRFANRDLTDLAHYSELLPLIFHMDRGHVMARDQAGNFRLLGVYASFPSDLDTELKSLGRLIGKFKAHDPASYERERDFVYQFLMELYGFPIAAERRTSAALFARDLSRAKEQYLIKVLGASDRTITSLCGFEQKRYPLVEKVALIALPPGMADAHLFLADQGYYLDAARRVVIFKVTYQQHKYNRYNVLEDRALSILRQEIIHPVHGGREPALNILKDTRRTLKELTDIVRGEHLGAISYKRTDLITSTKTHEERLKFLTAWLAKNRRRLGTYSPDSFAAARHVLHSYLLNREHKDSFAKHPELHREVIQQVVYLSQAQELQPLEKLAKGKRGRQEPGHLERLAQAVAFLEAREAELPYFYPELFAKCVSLWEQILAHPYFRKLASEAAPPERAFRRRLWDLLQRGRRLMQSLQERHAQIQEEVRRGIPLPLLPPETKPAGATASASS
jgi:hypothetical protein